MKQTPAYSVLFADNDIVVLNKKSGLLTAADRYDTQAPRIDTAAQEEFGRLFAVHRLDKDTSGAVIYARTADAQQALSLQFEKRQVHKIYHALVYGRPAWQKFRSEEPLLPDGDARHRTIISRKNGKPSQTDFTFLGSCGPFSWIQAEPLTGRTHQIRVHLAAQQISIVCDPLYGKTPKPVLLSDIKRSWKGDIYEERPLLSRLALHAYQIEFLHPTTQAKLLITAPYQKDIDALRKQLAKLFNTDPLEGQ